VQKNIKATFDRLMIAVKVASYLQLKIKALYYRYVTIGAFIFIAAAPLRLPNLFNFPTTADSITIKIFDARFFPINHQHTTHFFPYKKKTRFLSSAV
jgi:hypothetical protein